MMCTLNPFEAIMLVSGVALWTLGAVIILLWLAGFIKFSGGIEP